MVIIHSPDGTISVYATLFVKWFKKWGVSGNSGDRLGVGG